MSGTHQPKPPGQDRDDAGDHDEGRRPTSSNDRCAGQQRQHTRSNEPRSSAQPLDTIVAPSAVIAPRAANRRAGAEGSR